MHHMLGTHSTPTCAATAHMHKTEASTLACQPMQHTHHTSGTQQRTQQAQRAQQQAAPTRVDGHLCPDLEEEHLVGDEAVAEGGQRLRQAAGQPAPRHDLGIALQHAAPQAARGGCRRQVFWQGHALGCRHLLSLLQVEVLFAIFLLTLAAAATAAASAAAAGAADAAAAVAASGCADPGLLPAAGGARGRQAAAECRGLRSRCTAAAAGSGPAAAGARAAQLSAHRHLHAGAHAGQVNKPLQHPCSSPELQMSMALVFGRRVFPTLALHGRLAHGRSCSSPGALRLGFSTPTACIAATAGSPQFLRDTLVRPAALPDGSNESG